MAHKVLVVAFSMLVAAAPVSAANDDPAVMEGAPAGTPDTKYCMHVELTGSVIEPVRCWTREQWADPGVDVDKDWAKEGVAVKS